jgi:hypothetical protein
MSNFFGIARFYFPDMIMYYLLIYFCDVVKMVIFHKTIATFGYR